MNNEGKRSGTLPLDGDWTIERAGELKKALTTALEDMDAVVVDLEKVDEVDLSCLQLLCSAHRTSLEMGKQFSLGEHRPEVFRRVVGEAGYHRSRGCQKDLYESCLWLGGFE